MGAEAPTKFPAGRIGSLQGQPQGRREAARHGTRKRGIRWRLARWRRKRGQPPNRAGRKPRGVSEIDKACFRGTEAPSAKIACDVSAGLIRPCRAFLCLEVDVIRANPARAGWCVIASPQTLGECRTACSQWPWPARGRSATLAFCPVRRLGNRSPHGKAPPLWQRLQRSGRVH